MCELLGKQNLGHFGMDTGHLLLQLVEQITHDVGHVLLYVYLPWFTAIEVIMPCQWLPIRALLNYTSNHGLAEAVFEGLFQGVWTTSSADKAPQDCVTEDIDNRLKIMSRTVR